MSLLSDSHCDLWTLPSCPLDLAGLNSWTLEGPWAVLLLEAPGCLCSIPQSGALLMSRRYQPLYPGWGSGGQSWGSWLQAPSPNWVQQLGLGGRK